MTIFINYFLTNLMAKWFNLWGEYNTIGILGVTSIILLGILSYNITPNFIPPEGHYIFLLTFNLTAALFGPTIPMISSLIKAEKLEDDLEISNKENELLLHNIIPASIVYELKSDKKTTVKLYEQTSILFADLVNFTEFSKNISPHRLVSVLNGLFCKFDDLTEMHELEKIKTIGDAYMVASGVPIEKINHAYDLFKFAQDMLISLEHYNKENELNFQLRIGIHSGPIVAGIIGKKKFSYDLWGDTVNMAARMESNGQIGKIQVSENTYQLLKDDFTFEKVPNVEIKGKGIMDVYVWPHAS
ncbi:MAG: adenylate/guanylate cyclase domain-containing protein [Saprospiraceae bacterium]